MLTTQIAEIMERAKVRMLAAPLGSSQSELDYMTQEELTAWHEWRLSLPSPGELRRAARERIKAKIKARRGSK